MYGALTTIKGRVAKPLLKALPTKVAERVIQLATAYEIKSVSLSTLPEGYKIYFGEGDRIEMIRGEWLKGVEMAHSDNIGASGLNYEIGTEVVPPIGTWVIKVYYYNKYHMQIGNVVPLQIDHHAERIEE